MDRTQFARMLSETLVCAGQLQVGDVIFHIETQIEGQVVELDRDDEPIVNFPDGNQWVNPDDLVIRLFNASNMLKVYLPTNREGNLLQSNEDLTDVKGYVTVFVADEESKAKIFEINSEREHLVTDLTMNGELSSVSKLKKRLRRTLKLVAPNYKSGEESKRFFNDFMHEIV